MKGFLNDLYALAVKLVDCKPFKLNEFWRDAADFVTHAGDRHITKVGFRYRRGNGWAIGWAFVILVS